MDIGSILLGIALLVIVAVYVGRPFLRARGTQRETMTEREGLAAQKAALLEQIRTLDFEHETGKMPDAEHRQQRTRLLNEAATIMKQLDDLAPVPARNGSPARIEADVEAAIAAIRAWNRDNTRAREHGNGRFCTQCGKPRDAGNKFCAHCGFRFA